MRVKEAIEFLKGLDQDLPLILYEDAPVYGEEPVDADLQVVQLDQKDAELLDYNVGQKAVQMIAI